MRTGVFPGNSCGACCRRVGLMPDALIEAVGLAVDERGYCTLLGEDNRCMDYANRPPGCRVSDMQKQSGTQEDVYFELAARICNTWMDEDESEYDRLVVR